MAITNAHLHWFKLKCPYPQGSKAFRMAKAKLENATYADLERLRAEFEIYKDGSCKERRGAEVWTAFGTAFPK